MFKTILHTAIPKNKTAIDLVFSKLTLLNLKKTYPSDKFASLQSTLIVGDDIPTPGGSPKGDGNSLPITPLTKYGMTLVQVKPAQNAAIY